VLGTCTLLIHVRRVHWQAARNNVLFTATGEVAFPAASVVVVMRHSTNGKSSQRFYLEHSDAVSCLRANAERTVCASAQV
jgi:hypothetical protein